MPYDVVVRHQQALDPSALTTIGTTLHAIIAAIKDCRNAGTPFETDAAVILLARHLATICSTRSCDEVLKQRCLACIAELHRHPALITLAHRGVAYDEAAKSLFHSDGRKALTRLGTALGLDKSGYDLRSTKSGPAVSGEITLHGDAIYVQLSLGSLGPDGAVLFRRVTSRHDHLGDRNRFASIRELLAPDRFAARIRRELRLPEAGVQPERLSA